MSRPENENYAGLALTPDILAILQAGLDFRELEKSEGYRRLMRFLRGRAEAALKTLKDAPYADDRTRLSLLFQWQLCEDVVRDVEFHVRDVIKLARSVSKDVEIGRAHV